ncbi:long-chain-fatty-acyl-CoA reductase, partial [Pseudomonas sp. MWU13-2860]
LCPVGTMHDGYAGEPHDGVYALSRLTRRVSVSLRDGQLPGHATLDALPPLPAGLDALPVMDKMAFQQAEMRPAAQLFFRRGGNCSDPSPAVFTYRDYPRQLFAAADGPPAPALGPAHARAMNSLFGGNLHACPPSFYTVRATPAV